MVVGPTIAAAFDRLYYLEEACKRQVLAMSTNRPLQQVSPQLFGSCRMKRLCSTLTQRNTLQPSSESSTAKSRDTPSESGTFRRLLGVQLAELLGGVT